MNYKFKTKNGEVIRVFHNHFVPVDESHFGSMSWNSANENDTGYSEVLKDASGKKYFTYNNERIYMNDFMAHTPEELLELMNGEEYISSDELIYTLMKYGINCLHVMQRKKPMGGFVVGGVIFGFESEQLGEDRSKWDNVEYKFIETDMFKLSDNYKIKLTPADESNIGVYASREYYVHDIFELLKHNTDEYVIFENKAA